MAGWRILRHGTLTPDPEASLHWLKATTFLQAASPTAGRLLEALGTYSEFRTIYVVVHVGDSTPGLYENGFLPFQPADFEHTFLGRDDGVEIQVPPEYGTVWWWATRPKSAALLSPPMALLHELGHLYQWFAQTPIFANYNAFVPVGKRSPQRWKAGVKYHGLDLVTAGKAGEDYVVKHWELPAAKEVNQYLESRFKEERAISDDVYNNLLEPGRASYHTRGNTFDKVGIESRHARQGASAIVKIPIDDYYKIVLAHTRPLQRAA